MNRMVNEEQCNPGPYQAKFTGSEISTNVFQRQRTHATKHGNIMASHGSLSYI
jgi:hypothetical protein